MRDCVITAAGASSRMGGLWKPTLPFGASTILGETVSAARAAGLRVVLVVGYRGGELSALFSGDPGVRIVENPEWESGLPGSIVRAAAAADTPELFLMNGDKPMVRPGTYMRLATEADRRAAEGLPFAPLFAAFGGKTGHPVLVRRDWILAYPSAAGRTERMKDFLVEFGPLSVECGDPGVLADIDTREDYESLRPDLHITS